MLPNINWTEVEILNFFGLPKDTPLVSYYQSFLSDHQTFVFKTLPFDSGEVQYSVRSKNCDSLASGYLINNPNDNFPSVLDLYFNTQCCRIRFYKNGILHRANNKPASLSYKNNYLVSESFYFNGKRHNKYGPAYRYRDNQNSLWYNYYWVNGDPFTKGYFFRKIIHDVT